MAFGKFPLCTSAPNGTISLFGKTHIPQQLVLGAIFTTPGIQPASDSYPIPVLVPYIVSLALRNMCHFSPFRNGHHQLALTPENKIFYVTLGVLGGDFGFSSNTFWCHDLDRLSHWDVKPATTPRVAFHFTECYPSTQHQQIV